MSDEFDSLDETEKAAVDAAVNKCRALADQIESILRNERREFVEEDSLADLYAALKCAAKILEQKRRQPVSRSRR
jgi:glutathione S-transferase